jgi:hypothetical protein
VSDSDNPDLSEEDKRFLESDFAKDLLASPEFRQMLENQKRAEDIAKAAVLGREIHQPDKDDKPASTHQEPPMPMRKDLLHRDQLATVREVEKYFEELHRVDKHGAETIAKELDRTMGFRSLEPEYFDRQYAPRDGSATPTHGNKSESPTMVEFFERVRRYRGHAKWLVGLGNNWGAVSFIAACAWGGGVAAMQMDQFLIAVAFFVFTSFVLAVKGIASEKDRERTYVIAILAVLFLVLNIVWAVYSHRHFGKP